MLISIVIPTRDRAQYLRHSLATATAIPDPNIEIVVSDNASVDKTRQVVSEVQDSRVRYVNTGKRVSMRQNFEFALHHSKGDYVIFFGDDDGIIPGQFPFLRRILEEKKPDVLSWSVPTYGWKVDGYEGKTGFIRLRSNKVYGDLRYLNADRYRKDLLAGNLKCIVPLPAVYHGCASRDYLNRTSLENGVYFNAASPDYYFSYLTILHGGHFLHADHPFTISGHSPASTGGSQATKKLNDPTKHPGVRFGQEIQKDEVKDVVGYALSVPLALFSSVETARSRFPALSGDLDYQAWYGYVLTSTLGRDEALGQSIRGVLAEYAKKTGTQRELENAVPKEKKDGRSLRSRLEKAVGTLTSRRVDVGDTILSATQCCDHLLENDFGMVLEGGLQRTQAWRRLKSRKKARAQSSNFT